VLRIVEGHTPIRTSYSAGLRLAIQLNASVRAMLAHDRAGSGPPLILVHGLGMCKEVWRPVVPLLAREREVIAIDLPGFGASPPGPCSLAGLAGAVAAFADELGLARPHVAGNSLGGGVALTLGASGSAQSVCALSPVGFAAGAEPVYTRALLATTRIASRVLAPVAGRIARSRVVRAALTSHAVGRPALLPPAEAALWTRAYAGAPSFWKVLRVSDWSIGPPQCATTIAWGERDWLLPFSRQAPRARQMLPDARHITLRGCGHVPTWDDPEQVARVLLDASS
jgi:pimeloyl-ACP methyl ester carboxylesterase